MKHEIAQFRETEAELDSATQRYLAVLQEIEQNPDKLVYVILSSTHYRPFAD